MTAQAQYQAGYKLRDLKAFIEARVGDKVAKRMSAEMQDVQMILTPKFMGNGSFQLMVQRYTAEFYFDRFPYKEQDPAVLFANVGAWLMDNDSERDEQLSELSDPEVDVVLEDASSAEVIIEVTFEEPVKVMEDPEGPIYWGGKQYRIEGYDIWTATKLRDVVMDHARD